MTIRRLPGDEIALLRSVLDRIPRMLQPYGLVTEYTINVPDNSYTVDVHAEGLGFDETWMRLQRFDELQAILKEIVFACDEQTRTLAIQRAGCMLDARMPYIVK